MIGSVDYVFQANQGQFPPEQLAAQREMLIAKLLPGVIQVKLIYLDAKHTIPSEAWPDVEKQLTKAFEEIQLEKMMKQFRSVRPANWTRSSTAGHVGGTREAGVHRVRAGPAMERATNQTRRRNHLRPDGRYYRRHQDEFTRPAAGEMGRTDGPPLEVSQRGGGLSGHRPNGEPGARRRAAGRRGPRRLRRRRSPQRRRAAIGPPRGVCARNSTGRCSTSPSGSSAPIIKSPTGFHIIRVTEREEMAVTPFLEAQVAIHDKIVNERSDKQLHEYYGKTASPNAGKDDLRRPSSLQIGPSCRPVRAHCKGTSSSRSVTPAAFHACCRPTERHGGRSLQHRTTLVTRPGGCYNPLMPQLGVNIDHVATVRQARRTYEPDPVWAAALAEMGGADGITLHLREDRRHISDRDLRILRQTVTVKLNLEMACESEILDIACEVKPDQATLVPEKREEITTEGGLDICGQRGRVAQAVDRLRQAGISVSLFLDPDPRQIEEAARLAADAVELHTGQYAWPSPAAAQEKELANLQKIAPWSGRPG